jgi:hypothetical protein
MTFGFFLIAFLTVFLAPSAAGEPAIYEGQTVKCSASYPADSEYKAAFLDIGKGTCWQCPQSHPHRTIFPVHKGAACERRAYTKYKRASGPENPTGLIGTDCRSGWFLDLGLGKCYSCGGYKRTTAHVESARACSTRVSASRTRARQAGDAGCPDDQFQHLLSGRCYSCPKGSYRNANTGADPSEFNACTRCGQQGQKPCPVTTLRKSCDQGLVEHLIKGICVPSKKEILRRDAMTRVDEIGDDLISLVEDAIRLDSDPKVKQGLDAQSPQAAQEVESEVQAAVNPCLSDRNQTWTLGAVASANAIVGVALETGVAVDVSRAGRTGRQRAAFAYGGAEYNFQLAGGANAGLNYGCWRAQNNALGGDYHGVSFDLVQLFQTSKALKTREFDSFKPGKTVSIAVSFWYDPHGGDINPERDYLGFTITVGGGFGTDLAGVSYSRGTTGQVTGAFPPPLPGDAVFSAFYTFADDPGKRNEFVMGGPNLVRVRNNNVDGAPGKWFVYERKLSEDNLFVARNGKQTYRIEADGTLTWRSNRSDGTVIKLRPSG